MPTLLDIARAARLRPIAEVAADLGLHPDEVEPYGAGVAKLTPGALRGPRVVPPGSSW